tara:strand:+ start:2621 stop:5662 length:3042 start_codon:yes stop_codon:yes gene_type:complete
VAELVGEKTGKKTTAGKDLYKTPDGDLVSEKSVTFKLFGMYVNAPSIIKGKQYTEKEIKQMVEDGQLKPTSMHKTLEEAISAAKERSDSLLDTDEQTKRTFKLGGLGKTDAAKKQLDAPEKPKSTTIGGFLDKYVLGPKLQGKVNPTVGQVVDVATDFIPGVSEAKDVTSLAKNVASGNLVGAGIDAASLALGVIPIGGDALRRALKASVQPTKTKKAYKLFVEREGKLYPLFVDAKTEVPQGQYIQAVFPKEAFTAPNGKKYVPSKGAERTKGEKAKGTGDEVAVPDQETRQKLIDAGYSVSASTDKFKHGKVFAVAARPGFHASQLPVATHIGPEDIKISLKEKNKLVKAGITKDAFKEKTFFYDKDGKIVGKPKRKNLSEEEIKKLKKVKIFYVKRRAEDHVFAEVEMPDDVDYQSYLQEIGKTDINDHVPVGGSYKYVDGQAGKGAATNDSDKWVVGGSLKVNKVLTRQETKNLQELEGVKDLPYRDEIEAILGRKLSEGGLLKEKDMQSGIDDYVIAKTNPTEMNEGGMAKQMSLFQEGGLEQDGGTVDPVSGNEVPIGSSQEEVRDDIDAKLSEGEFVFPADVVRYIGLEKLMQLRQEAKAGLKKMEAMGQMGNSEEATLPDDIPFSPEDIMVEDDDGNEGELEMQVGGVVPSNQQGVYYQPSQVGSQFNIAPQQGQVFQPMPIAPMPQQQTGYMPSFVGQPMPPQQQYTGFQQFVPELQDYVNQTYVNEETGETLIIPHLNGKPIYPPPAGFVLQVKEDKQEEEVVPETVPTATVTEKVDKEGDSTTFENMQKRENEIQESYKNTIKSVMEQENLSAADAVQFIKDGNYKILGKTVPGFLFPDIKLANQDRNQQKFINFGLEDAANIVQSELDSLVPISKPTFTTTENKVIPTTESGKVTPTVAETSTAEGSAGEAEARKAFLEAEANRKKAELAKQIAEAEAEKRRRDEAEANRAERAGTTSLGKKVDTASLRGTGRRGGQGIVRAKGGIASKPKKMKRGGLASK